MAWIKSELELIIFTVTAGYLDEQCRNLVGINSAGFAQPLPASQVGWALLASVFPSG